MIKYDYLVAISKHDTACIAACAGLTPEQVAAIPRLVAYFTRPEAQSFTDIDANLGDLKSLREIFPRRPS